jgi:thermostable 8-oxoguanine DNA glycosylase
VPASRSKQEITVEAIKQVYADRRGEIKERLAEFEAIGTHGSDQDLWAEMVFCFFTGGCSAKMGLRSLEAIRHLLSGGQQPEIAAALTGVHRYPNARSRYVTASRDFLREHCDMQLRNKLHGFDCNDSRRDWLVKEKGIKGLGYKEATSCAISASRVMRFSISTSSTASPS